MVSWYLVAHTVRKNRNRPESSCMPIFACVNLALKETYLAKWKEIPKHAKGIAITRTAKSILAPSETLLKDWKNSRITWSEYEVRYRKEILENQIALNRMREIKKMSESQDIYLVCYEKGPPCHRFILSEMIKALN